MKGLQCELLDAPNVLQRCGTKVLHHLLRPYHLLGALRHYAYDKKFMKSTRVDVPVISIGNLAFGGTGKTPMAHLLATALSKSKKVAILTRGYLSEIEHKGMIKINQGSEVPVSLCGDEPLWLAQNLPDVSIYVGKGRVKSAAIAVEEGAELLILDDGLQHRPLERTADIVMIRASDPLGKGVFGVSSQLRDSPKQLKRARLIVASGVDGEELGKRVERCVRPFSIAPFVGVDFFYTNKNEWVGKRIAVFCGIGNPRTFIQTLAREADVRGTLISPDHTLPSMKEFQEFAKQMKRLGAQAIVCTEKDGVKLSEQYMDLTLPLIQVKAVFHVTYGMEHWEQFIKEYS